VPAPTPVTVVTELLKVGDNETTPLDGLNDHEPVPPPAPPASRNTVVCPWHTDNVPVIGAGDACTVTVFVAKQPPPFVKDTVSTPGVTPVSRPDVATIVAFALTTDHVLVPSGSVMVVEKPTHRLLEPEIFAGAGSVRNVSHVVHPLIVSVKQICEVSSVNGVKFPSTGSIVPIAGLVNDHVPLPPLGRGMVTDPAEMHTA